MNRKISARNYPVLPDFVRHFRPLEAASLSAELLLDRLIERAHERWRLRRLLRGLTWVMLGWSGVLLLAALVLHATLFDGRWQPWLQFAHYGVLLFLLWYCLVRPMRAVSEDSRVARYLEERHPAFGSLVSSAVDARQEAAAGVSQHLAARLVDQANSAIVSLQQGDQVEADGIKKAASWLLAVVLAWLLAFGLLAPLRQALPVLLIPGSDSAHWSPFAIETLPGDVRIARGDDLLITASTIGFTDRVPVLHRSSDGGLQWQSAAMEPVGDDGLYESWLFDVQEEFRYYLAADTVKSPAFTVALFIRPELETFDLTLTPPAYTRRPAQQFRDVGEVEALIGTRVDFEIQSTVSIKSARLKFADGSYQDLNGSDRIWSGSYFVSGDASYVVQFQQQDGEVLDVSPEYFIRLVDDLLPMVHIQSPGRDTRVSMIEEPLLRLQASDDQGIARVNLVLSVNGEQEQRIPLLTDEGDVQVRDAELEHIFYLEDLPLETGDLVSYYVEAVELGPAGEQRRVTSDIYFFEIRPFRNNFFQADQQAGGGGGGGGQGGMQDQQQLAEQQRQLVIATFKLTRNEDGHGEASRAEQLITLGTAQQRIRNRVEAIVRRIGSRAMTGDSRLKQVTGELNLAVEAMQKVERQFEDETPDQALLNAQIALKHLQRADSVFRDISVSMGQQQGNSGGSGSSQAMQELADLFRLELDRLRNQYETLPQAGPRSQQQQLDETLEKLREMAQRQQQQLERQLQRSQQASSAADAARQRALAEQLEAMARELERLTRERPDRAMEQSIDRMRSAAESMRRSAEGSDGGLSDARAAAENLREAERLLDQGRQQRFSEAIERSLKQVEDALRNQQGIVDSVERASAEDSDSVLQIDRDKQRLREQLDEVNDELKTLNERARSEQPETSQSIQQALRAARDYRLNDRIERSRGMMNRSLWEHALENEEQIEQGIMAMRDALNDAVNRSVSGPDRDVEEELQEMRRMAREMRALRDRGGNGQGGGGGPTSGVADGQGGGGWFRQEARAMQQRGQSMIDRLAEQGVEEADLETLASRLEAIAANGEGVSSVVALDDALRALLDLEYDLRSSVEEQEALAPPLVDPTEIPQDYQDMVADYYRSLSE